ncbi:MAG: elongation factor P, partial [SAR324 cluster bacterium]|nr:elongation factor P [SAR324 cluster bacterium]
MYDTNDLRKGLRIEIDKVPYRISDAQFVKPGKGNTFCRVKMKNLINGSMLDRTWKSGEKISKAAVEDTKMQFLYVDGGNYHFMDQSSYEQIELSKEQVGESWKWLVEQMDVEVSLYEGVA